jgi:hypothetical protein
MNAGDLAECFSDYPDAVILIGYTVNGFVVGFYCTGIFT